MLVPKGITSQIKALLNLVSSRLLPEAEATLRVQRKTYACMLTASWPLDWLMGSRNRGCQGSQQQQAPCYNTGSLQEGSRAHSALLSLTHLSSAACIPCRHYWWQWWWEMFSYTVGAVPLHWEYEGTADKSPWRSEMRDLSSVGGRSLWFGLTRDVTWKYPKQQVSAETERHFCSSRCNHNEKCDFAFTTGHPLRALCNH